MRNPRHWKLAGLVGSILLLFACSTVPLTERRQLNIIPASNMLAMSYQQYDDFLSKHRVIENTSQSRMVRRVGRRIQGAVERYFTRNGMADELKNYQWEFNLVEDEAVNAWCMPGGKVVIYTGILPVTRGETGLAVVMGHEVAHAVAEHANERMSQGLLVQMGGIALSQALKNYPQRTQQLWMQAVGLGAQFGVILPYSRLHESEADELGLIFMAMAGYDPREAVDFWRRMAEKSGGKAPPEFLSTHPSSRTRIEKIKAALPGALKYYNRNQ